MSSTFKWLVLKAATAIARDVSSLFYQTLYREIFREVYDLTEDGETTAHLIYHIGYLAAEESAVRQTAVFRLFPSNSKKILEYVPLLWELMFGLPMKDYTIKWENRETKYPTLSYIIKDSPLEYELGKDVIRDNLPWNEFKSERAYYGAIITGSLHQVSSYILRLKQQPERISITNPACFATGDNKFILECTIVPPEEEYIVHRDFTYRIGDKGSIMTIKGVPLTQGEEESFYDKKNANIEDGNKKQYSVHKNESAARNKSTFGHHDYDQQEIPKGNQFWEKLTDTITIDKLEELFGTPTGSIKMLLEEAIQKGLHMEPYEAFDHFVNYEKELIKIIGFLFVHLTNELGQIPQRAFENYSVAKIFGQFFKFIEENAPVLIPRTTIDELKNYFLSILEGMVPLEFIDNLKKITGEDIIHLIMEGAHKAYQDLGIPFSELQPNLYLELKKLKNESKSEINSSDYTDGTSTIFNGQDEAMGKLLDQFLLVSTFIASIPSQLAIMFAYNVFTGWNELFSKFFTLMRESSEKIVQLIDEIQKSKNQ